MLQMSERLLAFVESHQTDPVCYLLLHMSSTDEGNYLDYTDKGDLSYLPNTRVSDLPWEAKSRISGRVGKIVRKFITPLVASAFTDAEIERFGNRLRAEALFSNATIRLVSGDEIRLWYHQNRYDPGSGTLINSCMRYQRCQSWFNVYTQNPDTCQLLIMTDNATKALHGRALVWTNQDDTKLVDRIYGNDIAQERIERYALEQDWLTKWKDFPSGRTSFNRKGRNEQLIARIPLKEARFNTYPYCDTMLYLSTEEKFMSNIEWAQTDRQLSSTEGLWIPVRR